MNCPEFPQIPKSGHIPNKRFSFFFDIFIDLDLLEHLDWSESQLRKYFQKKIRAETGD
jgi:hypothetical protein